MPQALRSGLGKRSVSRLTKYVISNALSSLPCKSIVPPPFNAKPNTVEAAGKPAGHWR